MMQNGLWDLDQYSNQGLLTSAVEHLSLLVIEPPAVGWPSLESLTALHAADAVIAGPALTRKRQA